MATETTELFELRETHNPHRWVLPVEERICVGPPEGKFLFGGVGLAASITAMERTTGRPAIWATAQYLAYAKPSEFLDVDVIVPKHGKHVTQARVVGHVGDREILTVNAALGARPQKIMAQWARMPAVPSPSECEIMPHFDMASQDLHHQFEMRVAKGRYGNKRKGELSRDGHAVLWGRPKAVRPVTSGLLAVIADYVPSATGHALGRLAGANSLDNTIRIRELRSTEWMCCDIRIHGVNAGFVHGRMHIFAEDGTLMATASQSAILRLWDEREE